MNILSKFVDRKLLDYEGPFYLYSSSAHSKMLCHVVQNKLSSIISAEFEIDRCNDVGMRKLNDTKIYLLHRSFKYNLILFIFRSIRQKCTSKCANFYVQNCGLFDIGYSKLAVHVHAKSF